jgi:hypothetical protein
MTANQTSNQNDSFVWIDFSIVLVGVGISPNLYTSEYLIDKKVIDPDWNWKVTGSGGLPNLASLVTFNGGRVTIKVERTKVSFGESLFVDQKIDGKLPEIVKRFLVLTKHLSFTGMGLNYTVVYPLENTKDFLLNKFIVEGKQKAGGIAANAVGLKLVYPIGGSLLNLSIDEGGIETKIGDSENQIQGVVFQANFHHQYSAETDVSTITANLDEVVDNRNQLVEVLRSLLS